uniref:Uncharacterized protein n=1 Tax=Pristionchus pacificus TaxID=54126 RepID=A0A2A6CC95_PRIPA|eukprot:PDM75759.1 hypothetical protein PRIPAC_40138 [Pristionchus pacificus]
METTVSNQTNLTGGSCRIENLVTSRSMYDYSNHIPRLHNPSLVLITSSSERLSLPIGMAMPMFLAAVALTALMHSSDWAEAKMCWKGKDTIPYPSSVFADIDDESSGAVGDLADVANRPIRIASEDETTIGFLLGRSCCTLQQDVGDDLGSVLRRERHPILLALRRVDGELVL